MPGPNGQLNVVQIDDASWLAMEIGAGVGGSVRACELAMDDAADCNELVDGAPILTSITYRGQALWGSILALVPGAVDVVLLNLQV